MFRVWRCHYLSLIGRSSRAGFPVQLLPVTLQPGGTGGRKVPGFTEASQAPAPFCLQMWSHLRRESEETTWKSESECFKTNVLHSFQPSVPFSDARLTPCPSPRAVVSSWAAAHQPGNVDQVTRMKHSWLSARFHGGSVTFSLTQEAYKGTHRRTDKGELWRWLRRNFPARWFRVGRSSRAFKRS